MLDWINKTVAELENGGAGSGDFDHAGRPGEVGGSEPAGTGRNGKYEGGKRQWVGAKPNNLSGTMENPLGVSKDDMPPSLLKLFKKNKDMKSAYDLATKKYVLNPYFSQEAVDRNLQKIKEAEANIAKDIPDIKNIETEQFKETNKQDGEFLIKKETSKAVYLEKDGISFWTPKRYFKNGKLTPAGERIYGEKKEMKESLANLEKTGIEFEHSWESEKAYGVDTWAEDYNTGKLKKVRVFIPKSQIMENGNIPLWLFQKKIQEINEKIGVSGNKGDYGSGFKTDFYKGNIVFNSVENKIYTVLDDTLYEFEEEEKTNAKDYANTYKGESVMYEGIATYKNESVFLSKDTLKKCMPNLKGRPVIIEHKVGIKPDNMEQYAVGYVTDCEYNNETGDFDCNFVTWSDEAKQLLKNGYTLSTSYIPKEYGNGGTFINTPYDKEIKDLSFTHLAIVKNPRYEKVKVYMNSVNPNANDSIGNKPENQNDINEEKENYCMDKIEVEQGFLKSLLDRVSKTLEFSNAVDEEEKAKAEEEAKKKNEEEAKAKEEAEKTAKEKENSIDWFEKMQEVMNSNDDREADKIKPIPNAKSALEKGKKIYG